MHFISKIRITSKEATEPVPIVPYDAQTRFLEAMASGLQEDIHHFVCLKARQLGISTILLALDIFWLQMFPGLQGALIADTGDNKETFRETITEMLDSLPAGYKVKVRRHNRNALILANGSRLQYMSAGKAGNTGLGRSRALNFVHATECSSWKDQVGLDSLRAALALENPNRLYIFESTALGFNLFYDIYEEAKDSGIQKAFFIGWWAKEIYRIREGTSEFDRWWNISPELTDEEATLTQEVMEEYGHQITPEQWAWFRRESFNKSQSSLHSEFPTTERLAWQSTGFPFFSMNRVNQDQVFIRNQRVTFNGYRYELGEKFLAMKCSPTTTLDDIELRVWEDPKPDGVYVMGVDPAYGRDEWKDRSVISVWRCYADKIVQVAEYATPWPETRHVAWVMAHLAGCYRNVIINLEITGPGGSVMQELNYLRQQMQYGKLKEIAADLNPEWALDQARWFLYHRVDSMGPGYMYNWKCLDLETPLPTPTGWTTMGKVLAGDWLLDEKGNPTRVLGTSPVKHGSPCYRLTFDDGSQIVADEEHKWCVTRNHWKGEEKIVTTVDLLKHDYKIKMAKPLSLPETNLPVDPYVLGAWLGDGSANAANLTASEADVEEMVDLMAGRGLPTKILRHSNRAPTAALTHPRGQREDTLIRRLRALNVYGQKHIPAAYLRASVDQRLDLLRGLMDTDGGLSGNNGAQCGFTTTSERIAEGFAELVRSLGIKAKRCVRNRTIIYKGEQTTCRSAYQFWFTPPNDMQVFRLSRKARKLDENRKNDGRKAYHRIVSIEPVESRPVRCVLVDNPTHLFLAGESMIPTHNTSVENKLLMLNRFRDSYNTEELIVRSLQLLDEMITLVQEGSSIHAAGRGKDDRVMGAALAHYAWAEWQRTSMMANGETFDKVQSREAEVMKAGRPVIDWIVPRHMAAAEAEARRQELKRLLEE